MKWKYCFNIIHVVAIIMCVQFVYAFQKYFLLFITVCIK